MPCVYVVPKEAREGVGYPGKRVLDDFSTSCGCYEPSDLTTELSQKPLVLSFIMLELDWCTQCS